MNDPYYEMLIHEYKEFSDMLDDLLPILKVDHEALISWAKYTQFFCMDLIMHVDPGKPEHRAFYNNIVFPGGPEVSPEEYRTIMNTYNVEQTDACLYQQHHVTQFLIDYDSSHGTHLFTTFITHYRNLAEIFSDQSVKFRAPVERFVKEYEECADQYWSSNGATWGKKLDLSRIVNSSNSLDLPADTSERKVEKVKNTNIENKSSTQSNYRKKHPEIDSQYWIRIITPMITGGGCAFLWYITKSAGLLGVAIIAFIIMFFGFKANKQRCPNCRAWNCMTTIKSEKVGERKVKVRRNLSSTYYRSSGNTTVGTRQVFVNADELTYNEVYRCAYCGYEMKGTRRVVDDGIRW